MRIINGSTFSTPTISQSKTRGKNVRQLSKDVDPLKTNDGYTDPVGEAKRQLARAFVSGQSSQATSNTQAVYQGGRLSRARRPGLLNILASLQKMFGGALKR